MTPEQFCDEPHCTGRAIAIDPEDGRVRCAPHAIATPWARAMADEAANPEAVEHPSEPWERAFQ